MQTNDTDTLWSLRLQIKAIEDSLTKYKHNFLEKTTPAKKRLNLLKKRYKFISFLQQKQMV